MIIERTVYDVQCSKCWRVLASGYTRREDAESAEAEFSVEIHGERHAMCVKCKIETDRNGKAAR